MLWRNESDDGIEEEEGKGVSLSLYLFPWHGVAFLTTHTFCDVEAAHKLRRPASNTRNPTSNGFPTLLAFAGVFDGHDGSKASDYCAKGLLPHILLEAENAGKKKLGKRRFSPLSSDSGADIRLQEAVKELPLLESIYVRAFHHAQERFGEGMEPPKIGKTVAKQISWRTLLRRKSHHPVEAGGTTACTLSLVSASLGLIDANAAKLFSYTTSICNSTSAQNG